MGGTCSGVFICLAFLLFPHLAAQTLLSPEISETVFLAWRLTRDKRYHSYPWAIFTVIETHCRLPGGG
ncbi:hypothetical protein K438DRAFT_1621486 [Mycena galopus ATCC 62051]|nr:hypothetical protein K438DRAFT_1621486 [Mycena galopus ATCC 62051]